MARWSRCGTGTGEFRRAEGIAVSADSQLNHPGMIAVDKRGLVFAADFGKARPSPFDADGQFQRSWAGCGEGRQNAPAGIALDDPGNVYVSDSSGRLCKHDHDGKPLADSGHNRLLKLRRP